MNTLMNMVTGQGESSGKALLLHNEKSADIQKTGTTEGDVDTGAEHGAIFFQILKYMIAGSGKSDSGESAQQVSSRTGRSESDIKNERQNGRTLIDTVKRHISHRTGKSETHGSEMKNMGDSQGTAQGTVDAKPFSKIGNRGDDEEGKTVLSRHGRQSVREGFDVPMPTKSQRSDENGKVGGKTGQHFLHGAAERADEQVYARLSHWKISDEKAAGMISPVMRGSKRTGFRESTGENSQKDNSESLLKNLSAHEKRADRGEQNKHVYRKGHNGQSAPSDSVKQHTSTGLASTGESISQKMAEAPAVQTFREYARESRSRGSGELEIKNMPTDQTQAPRRQETGKSKGNMTPHFMANGKTGQGEDGARSIGDSDGLNSNEQRMKDFLHEVRLTDRTQEGKHSAPTRIEAQTMVNNKNQELSSVKTQDIINQVADAVQTKLAKGFGRVKIELNPPHLGSVDLDVVVRDNKVHVILKAEQYDVRQLLQSNSDVLKTALGTQGLIAETIDVSLHDRMGGNAFQFDRDGRLFDNRQDKRHDGRNKGGEETSPDGISAGEYAQAPSGDTNGQISLFA